MTYQEVKAHRKPIQRYHARVPRVKKGQQATNHRAYIAGAIWDEGLSKWLQYRDIIKHPEPSTRALWLKSGENEFGRLLFGHKC